MRLLTYIRNTPFFQLSEQQAASVLPGSLLIFSLVFLLVLAFFSLVGSLDTKGSLIGSVNLT